MLESASARDLLAVALQLDGLLSGCRLLQAKRRERGAWVKPGLADSAGQLERLLLASYQRLATEVMASLKGRSDDVSSGRLAQAKKTTAVTGAEIAAAAEADDLDPDEVDQAPDRSRLAAILMLILLWRQRHQAIADAKVREMFEAGRKKALQEVGKVTLAEGPISTKLQGEVLDRFEADIVRLESGLRDGTVRAEGIEGIVREAATLGEAAALLRRLFDSEAFRISMLAEALVWRAWLDGYRAGAIEATRARLQENGVHLRDGLERDDLSDEELDGVSMYEWSGPEDERACAPCLAEFAHNPILALDEDSLPAPEDICEFGRSCRHGYELVS